MSDLIIPFIAVLVSFLISVAVFKLLSKTWPKSGKMGINLEKVTCPKCGEEMPKVRKASNFRQLLWGGWTCSSCGTEMNKYGVELNS
ncbi:MAG: transposase [Cellvibrionaceae bacterium]